MTNTKVKVAKTVKVKAAKAITPIAPIEVLSEAVTPVTLIATPVLIVASNVTGKKLSLQKSRIATNAAHKLELSTLTFCLGQIKKHGAKYIAEINQKFGIKVTLRDIEYLNPVDLTVFMSDKDKQRQSLNGNKWGVWMITGLIAKKFNPTFVKK